MRKTNITKTILLIAILALMRIATNAQKTELVVQTGNTAPVLSVGFSPDRKIRASGSRDQTNKLWDFASGKILGNLRKMIPKHPVF